MYILIFIIGLFIGIILNYAIEIISSIIDKSKKNTKNVFVPIICALSFEILFLRIGLTNVFAKAVTMTVILIIITFIDLRHRIIPDFMVVMALVTGIIFSIITKTSIIDTSLGMICGGGIMFLLALVPNAMGGGDVKLMFAIGAFLGVKGTMWALLLAFSISSIVSIAYILFNWIVYKRKAIKDYIPFGPFLALGNFISLLIFT
jgi:leader peptidase (prepilin peptidase)/N-methyltransferase